jgi:hypothetical protein
MKREEKINQIKSIISEWGSVHSHKFNLDASPCLFALNNVFHLIECFNNDDVTVVSYHDDTKLSEADVPYEELSDDVLDEVFEIISDYGLDMEETFEKTKN